MKGIIAKNKKAYFNYEILEKFKAGIVLTGREVKSIKTKGVNLAGSYIIFKKGEVFWIGANILPYQEKNAPFDYNPKRDRKLLLKKTEIKYLVGKTSQKGLTLMPLMLYDEKGKLKLGFGLAKRSKKTDKREKIKKREIEKEIKQKLSGM